MAAHIHRAAASLIAIATRSHGFSSLVTRSAASSPSLISPHCSSSVFLPFSTTSADTPLQTSHKSLPEAEFQKGKEELSATPKDSNNIGRGSEEWIVATKVKDDISRGVFRQLGYLTLYLGSHGEDLDILVEEKTHDDCSETSLQMHIKFAYGHYKTKQVVFDVALQNGQGQVAIRNGTMRVDDYFQENIQVLMDEFKGLLQKGAFNCKVDFAVKFAKALKEYEKRVEPKVESVHAKSPKKWYLDLMLETKDETIDIKVKEKDNDDKGLWMEIRFMCQDNPYKNMEFDFDLLDDQGQTAIREVRMRYLK